MATHPKAKPRIAPGVAKAAAETEAPEAIIEDAPRPKPLRPIPHHYYEGIQGWFNFAGVFRKVINEAPDEAVFVEVGCWKGRSTAYLGVEILNSGKQITLHCVDHFEGSDEEVHKKDPKLKSLRTLFDVNVAPCVSAGLRLTVHAMTSVEAAAAFADGSVDFVWLDAGHDYESVKSDIVAWLPKVKPGGVIGGDDYPMEGVGDAVREFFTNFQLREENGWTTWFKRLEA